jgi:CBS domain
MTGQVEEFLAKAAAEPVELTVRNLLAVWGFRYRGYESTGRIQRDLAAASLHCQPPFTEGEMDSLIRVCAVSAVSMPVAGDHGAAGPSGAAAADSDTEEGAGAPPEEDRLQLPPVSLLVRDVPSATAGIISVQPSQTLEQAQHIMITGGFSQLAVLTGPTELKGWVSWASIAQAWIGKSSITLRDATKKYPRVVYAEQDLLGELDAIYDSDFVFVRDGEECICGIITTADLTSQFRELTTPFFQLGEIERRLRRCLGPVFSIEEIRKVVKNSKLESVEDMAYGQYCKLLEDGERWQRMRWNLDREMFVGLLNEARMVRNQIMHFGARPLTDAQKQQVNVLLNFMRHLDTLS